MDIIVYNILTAFCCFIVGYLFGSFPSGVVVGRSFFKQDPRDLGSKNSGGTNASRLWGFKFGIIVYILDFIKVAIPLWGVWAILTFVNFGSQPLIPQAILMIKRETSNYIVQWPVYWLVILGAVIGHCYPAFAKFKGGKAAAVTFSSAVFSSWFVGIVSVATFFTTLKIKKYISLSSMLGSIAAAISAWLTCIPTFNLYCMYGYTLCPGWVFGLVMSLSSIVLIIRHSSNIKRIINGDERKIKWM